MEGQTDGQTQVDRCDPLTDTAVWSHPLDLHFACRGLQGERGLLVEYRGLYSSKYTVTILRKITVKLLHNLGVVPQLNAL